MTAPYIVIRVQDPGELGAPGGSLDQTALHLGVAAGGTANVAKSAGNYRAVEADLVAGPLLDVASRFFDRGGRTFRYMRLATADAGAFGAVTQTGTGAVLTLTGSTPHYTLACKVEVTTAADVDSGNARVRYTLDDFGIEGRNPTWSQPIAVPASGIVTIAAMGLTLTFDDEAALVAGTTYAFDTTQPHYDATGVAAATPGIKSPLAGAPTFLAYTGDAVDEADSGAIADAIETQLGSLLDALAPTGAMSGSGLDVTLADAITMSASRAYSAPPFGLMGFGGEYVVDSRGIPGRGVVRLPTHDVTAVEVQRQKISTDPGWTGQGSIPGVVGATYDTAIDGDAAHDARLAVPRSWGLLSQGYYLTRARLLSPSGSDFISWQHAAIMIAALRAVTRAVFPFVLAGLRQTATLTMDPSDVVIVQGTAQTALDSTLVFPENDRGLKGHVSACRAVVDDQILLPAVAVDVRVRPFGYADTLTITALYAREP